MEIAERPANKKPFPPRFEAGRSRSYQVLPKKPNCGRCAIIIGRSCCCCGTECALATLRFGARVDLMLPAHVLEAIPTTGDTLRAGVSRVGRLVK